VHHVRTDGAKNDETPQRIVTEDISGSILRDPEFTDTKVRRILIETYVLSFRRYRSSSSHV
jgi:hypothetical protein